MTNDTRTTDEIERDIVDERAEMKDTFRDLQEKFSVDTIVRDIGDMVRDQGGDIGRRVSQTVGRNPAAVAVVGVGLAWLFLGKDRSQAATGGDSRLAESSGRHGASDGAAQRASPGWSNGVNGPRQGPTWYGNGHASPDHGMQRWDPGHDSQTTGDGAASGGMTGRVRGAAGTARHAASDAADSVRDRTSDLTARLSQGLEDLSEEGRSRVIAARRAAHEARMSSEATLNRWGRRASGIFEEQPLVMGALAVAAGAAFGTMLPRSRMEDDAMGESRDRLFAEAEAIFREERDMAMEAARKVGKIVASEARSDVEDMGSTLGDLLPDGKSAGDVVAEHASDAAGRMGDSATGTPRHKDLSRSET